MLGENIKTLRKVKGLTQEELAIRLHVVRQTVSKWEKNLSVPDAGMLEKLAEELDTPVSQLLGEELMPETDRNEIAQQLSRINEQLAIKNRRAKRIWTVIAIIVAGLLLLPLIVFILFGVGGRAAYNSSIRTAVTMSDREGVYSPEEVENAIQAVTDHFQTELKDCKLTQVTYDEDSSLSGAEMLAGSYPGLEIILIQVDFTTSASIKHSTWLPEHLYNGQEVILTRQSGSTQWQLRQIGGQPV